MLDSEAIRILYAEDDPAAAELLRRRLTSLGYVVELASDGEETVSMLAQGSFDLLLLDHAMRKLTGLDVIRALASEEGAPPIIMITGAGNESVAVEAMKLGAYEYLIKDMDLGYLDLIPSVMERALEKKKLLDDRQRAQQAMRESEEFHRVIVTNISDALLLTDIDGNLIFVTPNTEKVFGCTRQEILRKGNICRFLGCDFFSSHQVEDEEEIRDLELKFNDDTGRDHFVLVNVKRVSIMGSALLFSCRDITARKQAEDALKRAHDELEVKVKLRTADLSRANEELRREIAERKAAEEKIQQQHEFLSNIMESLTHPFYVIDAETHEVVIANKAGGRDRFSPRTPCYEVSHLFHEPCNPADPPCPLREVKRTGKSMTVQHTHYDHKGNRRNVNVHAFPVLDDHGQVAQIIEYCLDVTEHLKAEKRLLESEERFRLIIESAGDCIFVKDADRRYSLVNRSLEDLLDMPTTKILGKTDEELYGPEAGAHLRDVDLRVLGGERLEEEHTRPIGGHRLTFLDTRFPLLFQGEITGICGISRNITDRKQRTTVSLQTSKECRSQAMKKTLSLAGQVAQTDSIVLLTGESGSGKDYLAQYIHEHSARRSSPFFTINCAAVSAELAESELFGHEPGAFTGAGRRKVGLLELAEGGTLLLNEIGELSLQLQAKLLTFLDTKTFTRVGGEKRITVHARIIAATNRDLVKEAAEKRFRSDLFYRLNVFSIRVPSLRERTEDIPLLVRNLVPRIAADLQLSRIPPIDLGAMTKMSSYNWPGNVRELRNILERCLILSDGERIRAETISLDQAQPRGWSWETSFPRGRSVDDLADELRSAVIMEALQRCAGNRTQAAKLLSISRDALKRRMKALGLLR